MSVEECDLCGVYHLARCPIMELQAENAALKERLDLAEKVIESGRAFLNGGQYDEVDSKDNQDDYLRALAAWDAKKP